MSGLGLAARRGFAVLWGRRWTFLVPVATLLAAASLWVVHLKDVYRATAAVSVHPVSSERVGTALPQGGEGRYEQAMASARERLLSQANLKAMVPVLMPGANAADPLVEARARERVAFDQVGDSSFTVSISDPDPWRAAKAVNALVDGFLEGERDLRVRDAGRRLEIRTGELEKALRTKAAAQESLEAFRKAHEGSLPEQEATLVSEAARAEGEIRDREAQATGARRLLQEYEKSIGQAPLLTAVPTAPQTAEETQLTLALSGRQAALDAATKTLAELRSRYTDKYAAVVSAKAEVEVLEKGVATTRAELDAAHRRADKSAVDRRATDARGIVEVYRALRESVAQDETRAEEGAAAARQRLADLRRRIDAVPATRDALRGAQGAYDEAVRVANVESDAHRLAEGAVVYYERGETQNTTGFQVESRAIAPAVPTGPPRARWLAGAVVAGLLVGYGLLALRRRFDDHPVLVEDDFAGLVPASALVVTVPMLTAAVPAAKAAAREALTALWVVACFLVAVFAIAAYRGWIEVPSWFRPWLGSAS